MAHRDVTKLNIPFVRGLAQSVDPALMPDGALVRLENFTYDRDGALRVRRAYSAMVTTSEADSPAFAGTTRMFTHRGSLGWLSSTGLVQTHSKPEAPTTTNANLMPLSQYRAARLEGTRIVYGRSDDTDVTTSELVSSSAHVASQNGYTCVVWIQEDEVWGCVYADESRLYGGTTMTGAERTHQLVIKPERLSTLTETCTHVQVIADHAARNRFVILWSVAAQGAIKWATFSTAVADIDNTFVGGGNVVTDADSPAPFDVALYGSTASPMILLAYRKDDGSVKLRVNKYSDTFTTIADSYEVATDFDATSNIALEARVDESPVWVGYATNSPNIRLVLLNATLDLDAQFPVDVTTAGSSSTVGLCAPDTGMTTCYVVWQHNQSTVTNQYGTVKATTVTDAGLVATIRIYYGARLCSRPFAYDSVGTTGNAGKHVAVFLNYDGSLDTNGAYSSLVLGQITEWTHGTSATPLLRGSPWPVANLFAGRMKNQISVGTGKQLQRVVDTSVSSYTSQRFASVHGINATVTNGQGPTGDRVDEEHIILCDWDMSDTGLTAWSHVPTTHAEYTAFSGACPQLFDGQQLVELGFISPPHALSASATTSSSGGSMATGSYQYIWVWEWIDDNGRRHQSGACPAITVTHASGSANSVSWAIPPLRATWKTGYRKPYAVAYRTGVGPGSIFYRCVSNGGWPSNDATSSTTLTAWVDQSADATITGNETLYISSSIPQHETLPPSQHVVSHGGRLFGIDSTDRSRIWFTAPLEDQDAPVYSSLFSLRVDDIGPLVALASMDGKLYALSETAIAIAAYGDGPDKTGGGVTFPEPALLTSEAGCNDPRSVLVCRGGIYFAGWGDGGTQLYCWPHGDGQLQRIGASVRDELDDMPIVTSAVHVPEQSEIRFTVNSLTFSTSAILVYPYGAQTPEGEPVWHVHNGDGSGYQSAAMSRGRYCYAASSADYIEATTQTTRSAVLETGDLWPAGMLGHARIKATTVLGRNGPAVQNVDLAVAKSIDHGITYGDTKTFTVSGNSADGQPMAKRRQWRQQRTEDGSVRFKLTLSSDDGGAYDCILNGLTVEFMPESGGPRLSSGDRG